MPVRTSYMAPTRAMRPSVIMEARPGEESRMKAMVRRTFSSATRSAKAASESEEASGRAATAWTEVPMRLVSAER